jgi:hypothetical protein
MIPHTVFDEVGGWVFRQVGIVFFMMKMAMSIKKGSGLCRRETE